MGLYVKKKIKPFYDKGIYFYIQSEQFSEKNSSIKFNKLNKKIFNKLENK